MKVFTCFDVPEYLFPTAGHTWSTDKSHQDVCGRHLLTKHVRYYGDDVVAEDEISAKHAVDAIKVDYEVLPFVLDAQQAMKDCAPLLHENYKNNILAHSQIRKGNYSEAVKEPGFIKIEGWYDTPRVRVIKTYIGGGFGNKQDALYEPLRAWLTTQAGGR